MTVHVASTEYGITVMMLNEQKTRSLGVASADPHVLYSPEAHCWWINRVIVTNPEQRGQGLGSLLLDRLLMEIVARKGQQVIVTPGGYNADPDRQIKFYEKHGFVRSGEAPSYHWVWNFGSDLYQQLQSRLSHAT